MNPAHRAIYSYGVFCEHKINGFVLVGIPVHHLLAFCNQRK